jgi:YVTN family beta-propeller protein
VRGTAALLLALASAPAAAAQGPLLYVSNELSRDVSVVDAATRRVVATIPVGERPRGIQLSPDGRQVYVALSDDQPTVQSGRDAIAVIDVRTRRVVARYPVGTDPEQFGVTPDGATLYASNEDAGTASATDLRTRKTVATLVVGIEPEGVAVSPDGRWVYVTAETSNTVSVIDTREKRVVACAPPRCRLLAGRVARLRLERDQRHALRDRCAEARGALHGGDGGR